MIRLVATDLDGTLLRSDLTVSDRTRRALTDARIAGLHVVFMTGRPLRWLESAIIETGHRSLVACANGALIWDATENRARNVHPLEPGAAIEAVARLRSLIPGIGFAVERIAPDAKARTTADDSRHHLFAREEQYIPRWPMPEGTPIAPIAELLADGDVVKLLARAPVDGDLTADTLLQSATTRLHGLVDVTHSNTADLLLEMSALGVNKATALIEIAEYFDVERSDVAAIGDMPNDLLMLEWAGRAYAVSNAHIDVARLADEVLPSNNDDGVAAMIEELLRASS